MSTKMETQKAPSIENNAASADNSAGEVSLSVEETNKLRISLGLKPLEETTDARVKEEKARFEAKKKEEQRQKIREKIKAAKEKRDAEKFFAGATTLGEAETEEEDDIAAWIRKSRAQEAATKTKHEDQREDQEKSSSSSSEDEEEKEQDEGLETELAGKKVKHKEGDIKIGETMILTLEDQPILNQKGELNVEEDALENALKAEETRRKKAYKASKANRDDGFDIHGRKKDLLSKYDEEEEEAMRLDEDVVFGISKDPGQQMESLQTSKQAISDYFGAEEDDNRPAKRRKKKLRKKTDTDVLDIVSELEAQKEENMDWEADHGSRIDRHARFQQKEQEFLEAKELQTRKFDKALEKANLEALKLKFQAEDLEEEQEMFDALTRAQRIAEQQKKDRFKELAKDTKTKEDEKVDIKPEQKNLLFTDTTEFCRLISAEAQDNTKQAIIKEEDSMITDDLEISQEKVERRRHIRSKASSVADKKKEEIKKEDGVLREPVLGSGLAAALNTLRDKGDLKEKFEWVGRTNDMKKSKLVGVDDFYTCGEAEDSVEKRIETALTRKDPLGRVLTPKEAFRSISYAFHGKGPSQKTIEKRRRKMNDDYLANRLNLDQQSQLKRLKAVQKVQKNPFVVLTGTGQLGKEIREEKKKSSKKAKAEARAEFPSLTPILNRQGDLNTTTGGGGSSGGGVTPLEGKKKVEAMLGLNTKE